METETQPDATVDEPAAAAENPTRTFTLVEHVEVDGEPEPLNRVAFGADPRVVIHAGETFATDDARVAERCAAHPHLVETTKATAKTTKATAKKKGGRS